MERLEDIFNSQKSFDQLLQPYQAAIHIVETKLKILDEEMKCSLRHNPIHAIKSRLKGKDSIIGKLKRRDMPETLDGFYELQDIAGLRVICNYVNDINYVAQLLVIHDDINLILQKNYILYPKDSGYRSLHLIVEVSVYKKAEIIKVPVEIQLRTIAMDCWASLEHELHYKSKHNISDETVGRLRMCAEAMSETDSEMQQIYQELNSEWSNI
ncbi:MAG: GTP pyrophosphokinase family protein [Coprobacillaceae bacterium]